MVFVSGTAVVTLPAYPGKSATIGGGFTGLIFAVDTTGGGHNTSYPSGAETIAHQIPFAGDLPAYTVVVDGSPCPWTASQIVS